jgi:CheY-like chemotaxis protein
MVTKPVVWLIGDYEHVDFAEAVAWLDQQASLKRYASPANALRAVDSRTVPPVAIVIAVARPGRVSAGVIGEIHWGEPRAPLIALVGSLCEGEIRSGTPWPGVTRIYWHQWQGRLPRALGIGSGESHTKAPSRTFSAVDEGEQLARAEIQHRDALVIIRTAKIATYETLADACAAAGYRSVWQPPHLPLFERGADVILTDEPDDSLPCSTAQRLPRIVLLNFPRREDIDRARAAGAAAVVAKPFQLVELWAALEITSRERDGLREDSGR